MKSSRYGSGQGRFLVVLVVVIAYVVLLMTDGFRFFPQTATNAVSLTELCLRFGVSALVAALFLAVGAFTWLYARDRLIATLLFSFTVASMISITMQTAALSGDALCSDIGGASSAASLLPLFALLLLFPHNDVSWYAHAIARGKHGWNVHAMRGLLTLCTVLSGLTVVDYAYRYTRPNHVPPWLEVAGNIYFPLILICILATIVLSYFRSPSARERQQVRILLGGILLAFVPLLLLTVLPVVTAHPEFAVDGQISSLFYFLLPLSLCYSVLRKQILVYDALIVKTVTWLIGCIGLGVLCYITAVISGIAVADRLSPWLVYGSAFASVLFSPCLWWLAKLGTERLLFRSTPAGYRQLLSPTPLPVEHKYDLVHATDLFVTSAQKVFEAAEVFLFLRDSNSSSYPMYPPLDERTGSVQRDTLLHQLHPVLTEHASGHQIQQQTVQQLASSRRPLLLHDISHKDKEYGRIAHYLNTSPPKEDVSVLLAPVRAQGEMIAVLVLGTRADKQPYGGPDFDLVYHLIARYASILETARVTEQLRTAYERQKELDSLKDQFIMMASHELRTPLTAVVGYLELLEQHNGKLSPERRTDFIAKAHRGCDELTLMVNNIMDANRVQTDVESTTISPVSLQEAVVHVVEIVESISQREPRSISIVIPPSSVVMADDMRLRQVLLNLVGNALKYSPPGSPIEISAEVSQEWATIRIRDYGFGIPPEEHHRLFKRFARLKRDSNSPIRGTGLGLYICQQLISAMGGTIWIESTGVEGEGSNFLFTLPLPSPNGTT